MKGAEPLEQDQIPRRTLLRGAATLVAHQLRQDIPAMVAVVFIGAVIIVALFTDFVAPYDPLAINLPQQFAAPSFAHPLGLDQFGRDILSRLMYGARVSLLVGSVVITLALIIGTAVGAVAGYFGGKADGVLMRIADVFLAFPGLILAIGVMAALGQNLFNLVISIALVTWPGYARVVRSQVLYVRGFRYVDAARVIGMPNPNIIIHHVLPNTFASVVVLATIGMGFAILAEAGLSFLGLGVQPPTPSWGSMVAEGRIYLLGAPHIATFAGLTIASTVLAFNLLGDALRDALDPRLRI